MAYRDGAQAMIAFPHTSWAFVLIWRTILIDCSPKKNETGHFQSMPGTIEPERSEAENILAEGMPKPIHQDEILLGGRAAPLFIHLTRVKTANRRGK